MCIDGEHLEERERERDSMDVKHGKTSVLMFPWLAHGHMSPFLELSKKLIKRNIYVYFCSTPICLNSIKPNITQNLEHNMELVELHLPTLPDLPPHHHTTNGLPTHLMPTLKNALDMANPNFSTILNTLKPDLLIYDFVPPWAPIVARSHNIPAAEFITTSATSSSFLRHHIERPGVEFPFSEIYLHDYESSKVNNLLKFTLDRPEMKEIFIESLKQSSNIILIKSFREIEGKYIDYISLLTKKKILPVGLLVQDPISKDENSEIIEWLNKKDRSSTVFVSFGSEQFLSIEEMREVAYGLELSGVNFIWAVRFPVGEKIRVVEALHEGFLDRVGERGLLVEKWVPQGRILGHGNIGGFMSHCGWNSSMEGMKCGVPIICMPMVHDQPMNARLIVDIGIGVEVVRDKNGKLERENVAQVIREVVVEKSGEGLRKKAREFGEYLGVKGEEEIDKVVEELVQLCN